jgi:hypothetical protein
MNRSDLITRLREYAGYEWVKRSNNHGRIGTYIGEAPLPVQSTFSMAHQEGEKSAIDLLKFRDFQVFTFGFRVDRN